MSKPRKLKFGSKTYKELALDEAFSRVELIPCVDCGGPVHSGYCCTRCGSDRPENPDYEAWDTEELFA